MRTALAIFLLLHGAAHVVGFAVPWRLIHSPEAPYSTTIAGGAIDLGDAGIRAYGVLWLLLAIAFAIPSAQLVLRTPSWTTSLLIATAASAVLCALSLPQARIGLAIDVALLAFVVVAARNG